MDREDASRLGTMTTYLGMTNLVTPGLITADALHQRCAVMLPNIEAPHTLSVSQMKY